MSHWADSRHSSFPLLRASVTAHVCFGNITDMTCFVLVLLPLKLFLPLCFISHLPFTSVWTSKYKNVRKGSVIGRNHNSVLLWVIFYLNSAFNFCHVQFCVSCKLECMHIIHYRWIIFTFQGNEWMPFVQRCIFCCTNEMVNEMFILVNFSFLSV